MNLGVEWIAYTDIATDGMLEGPNVAAMREMVQAIPKAKVIASGGVTTVDDVRALKEAGAARRDGVSVLGAWSAAIPESWILRKCRT